MNDYQPHDYDTAEPPTDNRIRNLRFVLLGIIVLTVPFYLVGAGLLVASTIGGGASSADGTPTPDAELTATPIGGETTPTPTLIPTETPQGSPTVAAPLRATPYQFVPPPASTATWTPVPTIVIPTSTNAPTLTPARPTATTYATLAPASATPTEVIPPTATTEPPTATVEVPTEVIPPTATTEPPTAEPPTAEPPTAEPPTAEPPTAVPPTEVPAEPPTATIIPIDEGGEAAPAEGGETSESSEQSGS